MAGLFSGFYGMYRKDAFRKDVCKYEKKDEKEMLKDLCKYISHFAQVFPMPWYLSCDWFSKFWCYKNTRLSNNRTVTIAFFVPKSLVQ